MIYSISHFLSWLGDWERVVAIGGLVMAILIIRGFQREAWMLFSTVLVAKVASVFLKYYFERERPNAALWLVDVSGYSFPSGHATVAMALYGGIGYILWKNLKKQQEKYLGLFVCLLMILGISLSRLFLKVHWFSDIVGGWLVGIIALVLIIFLFTRRSFGK